MILAQPISGNAGNVLIGAGTVLKTSLCSRLQSWGVSSIWIESDGNEILPEHDSAIVANGLAQVDRVFQGRLVNSAMKTIYASILKYKGANHDES